MITAICWKWNKEGYRRKFTAEHVNTWARMIKRNYKNEIRLVCITDDPEGITDCETYPLWEDCSKLMNACGAHLPSCYRRLKLFSAEMKEIFGERIVSVDLDVVITGDLTVLWDRDESFIGWYQKGTIHELAYNGSMFLLKAGEHSAVWDWFDPDGSPDLAFDMGWKGSDQAWISFCMGRRAGWNKKDGVYSWRTEVMPNGGGLPRGAKVVFFNGKDNPWDVNLQKQYPWIKKFYR